MYPWDTSFEDRWIKRLGWASAIGGIGAGLSEAFSISCMSAVLGVFVGIAGIGIVILSDKASRKRDELTANMLNWQASSPENNAGMS